MKKKKTYKIDPERWLEVMQKGKTIEYAWQFFRRPMTEKEVKKETKSQDYRVSAAFKVWENKYCLNENTFYTRQLSKGKKGMHDQPRKKYELNLVPLFEYAKERCKEFTPQEIRILAWLFWHPSIREQAYKQYYKKDNVILGLLKFYFINYLGKKHIPKIYFKDSSVLKEKEEQKKKFRDFQYNFEDLRRQILTLPGEEEPESPYLEPGEKIIIPKKREIKEVKGDSYKVVLANKNLEIEKKNIRREKRKDKSMESDVWMFYFYYEWFHKIIPEDMKKIDYKVMELLDLI